VQLGESGLDRQLGAADAANAYGLNTTAQGLDAAGLLPMLRQLSQSGGLDMLRLGQIGEAQADEEKRAELDKWNFEQNAGWDNLGRYSGIIGGLGSLGGTTTSTGPGGNSMLGGLSGAAGGAGIAAMLGLTGPVGWGLAGLGGLMGAFG
jgi:hypothetical protein